MKNELKKQLFEYFKGKQNPNETEQDLLKELEIEMQYADIEGMCVCDDDVTSKINSDKEITFDELCKIASTMDDVMQDEEYGFALDTAINDLGI